MWGGNHKEDHMAAISRSQACGRIHGEPQPLKKKRRKKRFYSGDSAAEFAGGTRENHTARLMADTCCIKPETLVYLLRLIQALIFYFLTINHVVNGTQQYFPVKKSK